MSQTPVAARSLQAAPTLPPVLVGDSRALAAVRDAARRAARSDAKVLILGETGTGKEIVAHLIHNQSARVRRPFVAVNCSSMPETLLESELFGHVRGSFTDAHRDKRGFVLQADGGTLFLDELGEMGLRMQAMLLRFAESGEVQRIGSDAPPERTNVRMITATHVDLRSAVADNRFREDLYYRLNVIQICIPPLRDRADDIPPLLAHYFRHAAELHGLPVPALSAEAAARLQAYSWPGNVRELRNVTERLTVNLAAGRIEADHLPEEIRNGVAHPARTAPVPVPLDATSVDIVAALWERMRAGEDFWTVVHHAFHQRQLTRADLIALIDRGLRETGGSYRALLRLFNGRDSDYKRFHAFLYQQHANLPVAPYRQLRMASTRARRKPDARKTLPASSAAIPA